MASPTARRHDAATQGSAAPQPPRFDRDELQRALRQADAAHHRRISQQGEGLPIFSFVQGGQRYVATKNGFHSFPADRCRTFHDFLIAYVRGVFGGSWYESEITKDPPAQHPVLQWFTEMRALQRRTTHTIGAIRSAPRNGATEAFLRLAYDVYTVDRNVGLNERLAQRLRNAATFESVRFELRVSAIFLRAGFQIEFEDETDGSTTHVEFVATSLTTKRQFSVEAKRSEGNVNRLGRLVSRALKKQAAHQRVVFVDLNESIDWPAAAEEPTLMTQARRLISRVERQPVPGNAPSAYLFLANHPWTFDLTGPPGKSFFFATGFRLPDFLKTMPTIRDLVQARDRHIEMFRLIKSVERHREIPSTFDGSIAEYTFARTSPPLQIGNVYGLSTQYGVQQGRLQSAIVDEGNRLAIGTFKLENGHEVMHSYPLSSNDISAWRDNPDTFFGVVQPPPNRQLRNSLDLYDVCLESTSQLSREVPMESVCARSDFDQIKDLATEELSKLRAEDMAAGATAVMFAKQIEEEKKRRR